MALLLVVRNARKQQEKNNQGDIAMLFDNRDKNTTDFAKLLCTLDAPSFIGLTRLMQVKMFYDDVKDEKGHPMPRSAEAIIEDCLVKFHSMNRKDRREYLKVLRNMQKG